MRTNVKLFPDCRKINSFIKQKKRYNNSLQVLITVQKSTLGINKLYELIYSTAVVISRETGVGPNKEKYPNQISNP